MDPTTGMHPLGRGANAVPKARRMEADAEDGPVPEAAVDV